MKLPKMPKIKLPTKRQIKAAMPTILAVVSVVGNTATAILLIKETSSATLKIEQMKAEGATKQEIVKEVAPKFILPTVIFTASQLCTIECNVLNKKQKLGLSAALLSADYRFNKLKGNVKKGEPKTLPECNEGEVLFYDEYLETGKQDGYYACKEADWWKAYAKFQEKVWDPNYFCGEPTFSDFYDLLPKYTHVHELFKDLGSWPYYATWDIGDTCSSQFVRLEEAWIDENTKYWIVNWLFPPTVSEEAITNELV